MIKPKVLYHASPNKNIKILEPKGESKPNDFSYGHVVFATHDFVYATHFLVLSDDSWTIHGAFDNTSYFVCSDKKRFLDTDEGGAIYYLSPNGFVQYNREEYFSKRQVVPIKKIEFESGLEAMLDNKVQTYFVDDEMFNKMKSFSNYGLSILKTLQSENQKRSYNVVPL